MSSTEQDNKILSSLIEIDRQTSYSLSQQTGISIPQINFRLGKLIESMVITEVKEGDKTIYTVHGSLKSKKVVDKVADHIKEISDVIDKEQYATPDGMKSIICFILSRITIEDSKELLEIQQKVAEFRKELEEYAKKNDLTISDIKGWTKHKIEWMALNDRLCACVRDGSRHCPCPQGLEEAKTKGKCTCSLYVGNSWLKQMDKKLKNWR